MISIGQQIEEMHQVIADAEQDIMRGKKTRFRNDVAHYRRERLKAIMRTLEWVQANRDKLHAIRNEAAE